MVLLTTGKANVFQSTLPVWAATLTGVTVGQNFTFQSTLPVWAATYREIARAVGVDISIHAARVGSDIMTSVLNLTLLISIHAARVGSDDAQNSLLTTVIISIHAARVGSDTAFRLSDCALLFQSTLPVWAATKA